MLVSRCLPHTYIQGGTTGDTVIPCHLHLGVNRFKIKWNPEYHSWQFGKIFPPMGFAFCKLILAAWQIVDNPCSSNQSGAIQSKLQRHPVSSINLKSLHSCQHGQRYALVHFRLIWESLDTVSRGIRGNSVRNWQATSDRRVGNLDVSGVHPSQEALALPWGHQLQMFPRHRWLRGRPPWICWEASAKVLAVDLEQEARWG